MKRPPTHKTLTGSFLSLQLKGLKFPYPRAAGVLIFFGPYLGSSLYVPLYVHKLRSDSTVSTVCCGTVGIKLESSMEI